MRRIPRLRIPVDRLDVLKPNRPYDLTVHDLDHELMVHGFRGREGLSELFRFDVDVTTPSEEELEETALGRPAALVMRFGGLTRTVRGVVAAARLTAAHPEPRRLQYRLRLVPRMWLLRHRKRSRIFQDLAVPDVVERVLAEIGIEVRWVLEHDHPKRAYLTQYEETDWAFVRRLIAEAGMYFAHEPLMALAPPDQRERIWVSDGVSGYASLEAVDGIGDATLPFLGAADSLAVGRGGIFDLRFGRAVRAQRAAYREYDPERPGALLEEQAGDPDRRGRDLETYEHHGPFHFPDWRFAKSEPDRILRQRRRRAVVAEGEANSLSLLLGHRFHMLDHPVPRLNADFVVTAVRHQGHAWTDDDHPRTYESSFACVPPNIVIPAGPTAPRRPLVTLTATVVGPGQDDIHVDEHGRIKVRFHWDRRPRADGHDSCWLRSMQTWAGGSFGTQFIPRVGMEVVVSFEGGDPDKPLVLGCVYNGHAPPPFATPGQKTRSGIKTRSSANGDGYNELSFEDAKGEEQIRLRAERDLVEEVSRNHTLAVGGDEDVRVAGHREDTVLGSRRDVTEGLHVLSANADYELAVGGSHRRTVAGSTEDVVGGNCDLRIEGARTHHVLGRDSVFVEGDSATTTVGDVTVRRLGNVTEIVGGPMKPRTFAVHAEGALRLYGTRAVELGGDTGIQLQCGRAMLRLTEERIELEAPSVRLSADGAVVGIEEGRVFAETGAGVVALDDERLVFHMVAGASASFGAEVHIDGTKVLINSPDRHTEDPSPPPPEKTVIELVDPEGRPMSNQRYVILLADGTEIAGRLGEDGRASVDVPADAGIRFPDLQRVQRG